MSRFLIQLSLRSMFDRDRSALERIRAMRATFARLSDAEFSKDHAELSQRATVLKRMLTALLQKLNADR